jgi:hypothetical protein
MSIYDENLNFLSQKAPDMLRSLQALPELNFKTETAKSGALTLLFSRNNTPYYIHSKFDPVAESEKIIAKKNIAASHIVIMGLGLGYHVEKIMEKKHRFARVLLIEPEAEIIKHSLKTLRWKRLLNHPDFFYVFTSDLNEISRIVHSFINIIHFDTVEFIELPSETRIFNSFFVKAGEIIKNDIRTNLYDFKTRLAESYMLPRNVLKNLPWILRTRPTAHLKNCFPDTPGFIVSAGPSLDKNVLHLKKIKNRALLIAVDTAVKPLLKRSIQPHFTAIGDPSHKNYLHIQGTENQLEHFIAAEASIAHQVFRDFHKKAFTLSVGKPIVRMIEKNSEPLGELEAWGSVISIALELAVFMGLNPIVFVGQDFAFTDTRNHCRGTSWEEYQLEYNPGLDRLQRFEKQSIGGNKRVIETVDVEGNKTFTSDRLVLYKNYLARLTVKYPQIRFINATEGGIFSEIPQMRLYEVIKRFVYGRTEIDFQRVHQFPSLGKKENIERLGTFFNIKTVFFKDYLNKVNEILKVLEEIKTFSVETVPPVLAEAENVKDYLYAVSQNGEIVELWSLAPIYYFLKGFKRLEQKKLDESYLRQNVKLYTTYFQNIKPLLEDIVERFKETRDHLHFWGGCVK